MNFQISIQSKFWESALFSVSFSFFLIIIFLFFINQWPKCPIPTTTTTTTIMSFRYNLLRARLSLRLERNRFFLERLTNLKSMPPFQPLLMTMLPPPTKHKNYFKLYVTYHNKLFSHIASFNLISNFDNLFLRFYSTIK